MPSLSYLVAAGLLDSPVTSPKVDTEFLLDLDPRFTTVFILFINLEMVSSSVPRAAGFGSVMITADQESFDLLLSNGINDFGG